MNYYIVQLAEPNNTVDGKERLLILELPVEAKSNIAIKPSKEQYLTISKGEFEKAGDDYDKYRDNLINSRISYLEKSALELAK